jgi:hypothetical protein
MDSSMVLNLVSLLSLLLEKGEAIGYAGFIIHLHWTEPSNFILSLLFQDGYFHKASDFYRGIVFLICLFYLFNFSESEVWI